MGKVDLCSMTKNSRISWNETTVARGRLLFVVTSLCSSFSFELPKSQKENDKRGAAEVTRDGSSIIQFFWESVRPDSIGRRGKLLKTGRVDDLSKIWFVENMIFWKDDLSKTWFVEKILRIKDNKSKNDWFKNRFVKKKSHLLLDKHSHWVN